MFSEVKITETYCMANDFYKDLYCNRKNIWSKLVYFINGSGGHGTGCETTGRCFP